jgi:hypothetical protein
MAMSVAALITNLDHAFPTGPRMVCIHIMGYKPCQKLKLRGMSGQYSRGRKASWQSTEVNCKIHSGAELHLVKPERGQWPAMLLQAGIVFLTERAHLPAAPALFKAGPVRQASPNHLRPAHFAGAGC